MNNKIAMAGLALATLFGSSLAQAADAVPSNEVRLGIYIVQYSVKADDITSSYVPANAALAKGLNLDAKNVNTVYFAYLRRFTPHWSVELTAGWPPKTDTVGKGPATLGSVPFNGVVLSSAKWFAPSLLACYTFLDESRPVRPYVEAGVNFTHFYDRQSTPAGNAANGGPTSLALTNSVGPAATLGLSWHPLPRWGVYASYSASKVSTDLVANTAGVLRRTHINFNPGAFVVSTGYSF